MDQVAAVDGFVVGGAVTYGGEVPHRRFNVAAASP
jgi:hypothetical protein